MGIKETSIGGVREAFPETLWSSILSDPDRGSEQRRARLQQLLGLYWRPVYRYVRVCWKCSIEDAKDLTQEFFAHILEGDLVARYQPSQGRFRSFLKASLKFFLAETYRDRQRLKRGGGRIIVPLAVDGDEKENMPAGDSASPEELYDREWADGIMADCLSRLRASLRAEGKEAYFQVYHTYDLSADEKKPTYQEIAGTLGLSVSDVRNYLFQVRARLKDLIVERIRAYVTTREELVEELGDLLALFRR